MKHYVAYPSVDIYVAIDQWLDKMITEGKLEEVGKCVERGDVGQLNITIKGLLAEKNLVDCDITG